jgi:hypothetical protein
MLIIYERFDLHIIIVPLATRSGSGQLSYDIVPVDLEASIMINRMNSINLAVITPELGRKMIHKEGVD